MHTTVPQNRLTFSSRATPPILNPDLAAEQHPEFPTFAILTLLATCSHSLLHPHPSHRVCIITTVARYPLLYTLLHSPRCFTSLGKRPTAEPSTAEPPTAESVKKQTRAEALRYKVDYTTILFPSLSKPTALNITSATSPFALDEPPEPDFTRCASPLPRKTSYPQRSFRGAHEHRQDLPPRGSSFPPRRSASRTFRSTVPVWRIPSSGRLRTQGPGWESKKGQNVYSGISVDVGFLDRDNAAGSHCPRL